MPYSFFINLYHLNPSTFQYMTRLLVLPLLVNGGIILFAWLQKRKVPERDYRGKYLNLKWHKTYLSMSHMSIL